MKGYKNVGDFLNCCIGKMLLIANIDIHFVERETFFLYFKNVFFLSFTKVGIQETKLSLYLLL